MRLTCKQTIYTQTHVETIVIDDHQASAKAACVLQVVVTTDSGTAGHTYRGTLLNGHPSTADTYDNGQF